MDDIPNVLATRYASAPMRAIWSPVGKVVAERQLWLAVLAAQERFFSPTIRSQTEWADLR